MAWGMIWPARISNAIIGLALVVITATAAAAENGPYFSTALGLGAPGDVDGTGGVNTRLGGGFSGNVALGYRLGGFRLEAEISGQAYSVEGQTENGAMRFAPFEVEGKVSVGSLMGNLYYTIGRSWPVRPYIGLGAGIAKVSARYFYVEPDPPTPLERRIAFVVCPFCTLSESNEIQVLDDSDEVRAYQVTLGATTRITESSEGFLQYRFFMTEDAEFADVGGNLFVQKGIRSHNVMIGARWFF